MWFHPQRTRNLDLIARARDARAVQDLLAFLFSSDDVVAASAAQAVDQIVRQCCSAELLRLDDLVRNRGEWHWPDVAPSQVARLSGGLAGVLGVFSSHRNGYMREAAVRELAADRRDGGLPFLLIRVNDWVPEVRAAAKQAVLDRLQTEYAREFVRYLPLVFRLKEVGRSDSREIIAPVLALLGRPECRDMLREGLTDSDRQVRRATFRTLLSEAEGARQAIRLGLESKDILIRHIAAREARARLEGPDLEATLSRMLRDRFMPVRREALYGFFERLPQAAIDRLRTSLFDPRASVRETARFFLQKRGENDAATRYRNQVCRGESSDLAIAIAGLGETGVAADAVRLERFLDHPAAAVRKASVRALSRLDAGRYSEQFLAALTDPASGVVKMAREILRRQLFGIAPRQLESIYHSTTQPHSRRAVLSLIAELNWWDGAALLLAAAESPDQNLRQRAMDYLRRWRANGRRSTFRPAPEQVARLTEARRQFGHLLDAPLLTDLDIHLAYAMRQK